MTFLRSMKIGDYHMEDIDNAIIDGEQELRDLYDNDMQDESFIEGQRNSIGAASSRTTDVREELLAKMLLE